MHRRICTPLSIFLIFFNILLLFTLLINEKCRRLLREQKRVFHFLRLMSSLNSAYMPQVNFTALRTFCLSVWHLTGERVSVFFYLSQYSRVSFYLYTDLWYTTFSKKKTINNFIRGKTLSIFIIFNLCLSCNPVFRIIHASQLFLPFCHGI